MQSLRLGASNEFEALRREFGHIDRAAAQSGGEIIIICYNGFIPRRIDTMISVSLGNAWVYVDLANLESADEADFHRAKNTAISAFANDTVTVALPKMQRVPNRINSFSASVGGKEARSVLVSNIAVIAEKSFAEDLPKIYARTLARAAIKFVLRRTASQAVEQQTGNATLGLITNTALNIFNTATETSDTRGWNTLPETILMARIPAAAGKHEITVNFKASNGDIVKTRKVKADVGESKKTFVILRSFA